MSNPTRASPNRESDSASGMSWLSRMVPQGIRSLWRKNNDLLGGTSSLIGTTLVTSVLGFAFWALAARLFSQQSVGYGSAAVSAMTLLGTIGMLGMGTVLIRELPRRTARSGLISAALFTSGLGALIIGLVFVVGAAHLSSRFHDMSHTLTQDVIFIVGVALTAVSFVFDQATIGMMRGSLQLSRNLTFTIVKFAVLPLTALIMHNEFGVGITLSWVIGIAISAAPIAIRLGMGGNNLLPKPDWAVLRGLGRSALAHNWLNLAIGIPRSSLPVLVVIVVSPSANAAFYAAWTLTGFLYTVPTHLATVLFAIASGDPGTISRKLRFSLRISFLVGLPGTAVLAVGAHMALSIFGASYARTATIPMLFLLTGYFFIIFKTHYVAVCRATDRIPRAATLMTVAGLIELCAASAGAKVHGLTGFVAALVLVFAVEGIVTIPPVMRVAFGYGRHRRDLLSQESVSHTGAGPQGQRSLISDHMAKPAEPSSGSVYGSPDGRCGSAPVPVSAGQRERQERGIAVLLSLARSAGVHLHQGHSQTNNTEYEEG